MSAAKKWTMEKSIPLLLIVVVLTHFAAAVWWAGQSEARDDSQDEKIVKLERKVDENSCFKEDLATMKNDIVWIKNWLKKLEEK